MNTKTYVYPYKIQKTENSLFQLVPDSNNENELLFEQFSLLNSMLQFGYSPFTEGQFKITDKQLIDFFNYFTIIVKCNYI